MSTFLIFLVLLILAIIFVISGVFVTKAAVKLHKGGDTEPNLAKAHKFLVWTSVLTWIIVALIIILIVLGIVFGATILPELGIGTGSLAGVAGAAKGGKHVEGHHGIGFWLIAIGLILAIILDVAVGVMAAYAAVLIKRYIDNVNTTVSPDITEAYHAAVIAAVLTLVAVGLLVIAVIAYSAHVVSQKRKLDKMGYAAQTTTATTATTASTVTGFTPMVLEVPAAAAAPAPAPVIRAPTSSNIAVTTDTPSILQTALGAELAKLTT